MMQTQTLNTYNSANDKTAQIMARYKPIAPRPQDPTTLTQVLPHLQTRPSRTRKRGRTSAGPPFSAKRINHLFQFPPPLPNLPNLDFKGKGVLDLNKPPDHTLQERDFLKQLQSPTSNIITPRPMRLVNSVITVWNVTEDGNNDKPGKAGINFIEEVEFKTEPVIVTDSKNQVRAVSAAYKELVSQPECMWLQALHKGLACRRICGQVMVRVTEPGLSLPVSSNGFSGRARIEWELRNGIKRFVDVFFDATKFWSDSKDFQFAWRFYNLEASKSCFKL